MFDKQLDIYEKAYKKLEKTDDFPELINEILDTGMEIAGIVSATTDEDLEELKEDYGEEYALMCDSIGTVRDRYYKRADRLFLEYTYNFVERRTILYKNAADRYCKAACMEELNSIKDILKRYSALSFVDDQRACDPPERIRKEYEAAKELADNCFEAARKRVLDENE